jgi:hypothetical protein
VEVTFRALSRVIGRSDDSSARSGEFSTDFWRWRSQWTRVGKVFDAPFGARRNGSVPRRPDHQCTPDAAIDD